MTLNIDLNNKSLEETKPTKEKFVPKEKQRKIKRLKFLIITLILIIALTLFAWGNLGTFSIQDRFKIEFAPMNPFNSEPQLKKDSTGKYTNAMIVGIDTRDENPGLRNTDTIILLSYNHDTKETILLSIPRDFFVEVPGQGWYTKINGVYNAAENREQGKGISALQETLQDITMKDIQYYGMVNLASFTEIIDILGGIEVDVENSFTDYRYPVEGEEDRHQIVSFSSGLQTMDGITALRFVRSRYSLDAGEGSDFARARRQQRVIMGVKNKALSTETLLNPIKVFEILSVLEKNIKHSQISTQDIQAISHILKNNNLETYSFVLDPSIANYKIVTDKGVAQNAYAIGPVAGIGNYTEIHDYLNHAYKNPKIYSEKPTIYVYDMGIGWENGSLQVQEFQQQLPYINIQYGGTLTSGHSNNYIFHNSETSDSNLTNLLSEQFSIENTERPEFIEYTFTNGYYIILLGKEDNLENTDLTYND